VRRCRRTSPAGQPDVDWDDPAQEPVDGVEGNAGDSVLIYGNAMMDTEHAQYFEIHPVGAYYVMARHGRNHETWNRRGLKARLTGPTTTTPRRSLARSPCESPNCRGACELSTRS
jgi:hypothetical protein